MNVTLTLRIVRLTENGEPKLACRIHRDGFGTDNMETLADRLEDAIRGEMQRIGQEQGHPAELRRERHS